MVPGLVNVYSLLWKDPPFFMGKLTISMAIFHSYVKLPEGIPNLQVLFFSTLDFQGDTWLDSTMQVDLPHSQPEQKHVGDIVQCRSQTWSNVSRCMDVHRPLSYGTYWKITGFDPSPASVSSFAQHWAPLLSVMSYPPGCTEGNVRDASCQKLTLHSLMLLG